MDFRKQSRKGYPRPLATLEELLARCSPDGTGCLMYPKKAHRYGIVNTIHGRHTTSRAAFLLAGGTLLPGQLVCHKCDKPGCCNPEHLEAGSPLYNQHDRIRKGRHLGPNPLSKAA